LSSIIRAIPQGDETPAWPQDSLEFRAGFVEVSPMERGSHADEVVSTRRQARFLGSAAAPNDFVLLRVSGFKSFEVGMV
jgi:hypothetical protein